MTPAKIQGQTHSFGAPKDWDAKKNGECLSLPVRVGEIAGYPVVQSAWLPSRQELDALISGQAIVLSIFQDRQPVMSMHVERPAE